MLLRHGRLKNLTGVAGKLRMESLPLLNHPFGRNAMHLSWTAVGFHGRTLTIAPAGEIPVSRRPWAACLVWLACVWSMLPSALAQSPETAEGIEFFEERIRPVLIERCYECHNSSTRAEAGLALDHRAALRRGSDSGPVLAQPPGASLLIRVLRHEIDGLEMPAGGPQLDDSTIDDFERWIAWGAPDPREAPPPPEELAKQTSWESIRKQRQQWWSFQPIADPRPPTPDLSWSDHPVDRFVLQRMLEHQLSPNPEAPRPILIRRLYLALLGLPPDPRAIQQFLADPAPDAYERLVDRLLESQHFGERWARHWMDWVRYAESHGSEGDPPIEGAYHYRDYLIRALNADVPFDQLLREHIAGDLLPQPRIDRERGINESIIGTAHWRMVFHGFAPTDALDERVRFNDDALGTFCKAFLGLTVSCARCHDHKFDPISQADYYALYGILDSTRPGRHCIDLPERLEKHRETLAALQGELRGEIARLWLEHLSSNSTQDLASLLSALGVENGIVDLARSQPGAALARLRQAVERARAQQAAFDTAPSPARYELQSPQGFQQWFAYGIGLDDAPSTAGQFTIADSGDRLLFDIYPGSVLTHAISTKHPGRLTSPDILLDQKVDLWLLACGGGRAMSRYVVQNYPRNGTVYPVTEFNKTPQDNRWRWIRYPLDYWQGDAIHIELTTAGDAPLLVKPAERSWFAVRRAAIVPQGTAAPPSPEWPAWERIASIPDTPPETDRFVEVITEAVRAWSLDRITDADALLLSACLRAGLLPNAAPADGRLRELVDTYRRLESEIPVPTRVPGLDEWRGHDHPLFERGDHRRPGPLVPRRFLEAIDARPYHTPLSGRLELADDMLRSDNPLTARVIVNRVWHHLFGRGLVPTVDNLGRLGEPPSHPLLLDYLATELRTQHGWSLKRLIRSIVLSRTWRQDSQPSSDALRIDPANRWLSHFSVARLDAESIRDALLAVSGRLDSGMFGPSVPGSTPRRSVYVRVIRNNLDPLLTAFDAPVPFSTTGRRDRTNVPAQALILMNNPMIRDMATELAAGTDQADAERRVTELWWRILGRAPERWELQASLQFIASTREAYRQRDSAGDAETAAWIDMAHSLLNTKEFLYVR
ncbi:MAG: DUF1553 domain-containing protein [Planctomycetota bacterium]|nr:MAG: DUF1553 domain-containing protein [Planctomycetota bacterium]